MHFETRYILCGVFNLDSSRFHLTGYFCWSPRSYMVFMITYYICLSHVCVKMSILFLDVRKALQVNCNKFLTLV